MKLKDYQEPCDKCSGNGVQFKQTVYEFFKNWREMLGLTQTQVVIGARISDIVALSKFENGAIKFSEGRMRDLAVFYTQKGLERKNKNGNQ